MEHPWEPQIWTEPKVMYEDMQAQGTPNMPHFIDQKDYHRNVPQSQSRTTPVEYSKSAPQPPIHPRKGKHSGEIREDMMGDPSRFGTSQGDMVRKDDDSKAQYLYRKQHLSSPAFSPTQSSHHHHKRYDRRSHDRARIPIPRYTPRIRIQEQERVPEECRRYACNGPRYKKSSQTKREPIFYHSPSPPPCVRIPRHTKRQTPKPRPEGFCTSCVLCRVPNNYSNPCCLCEVPVCECCMKSNQNITNWRSRINSFISKDDNKKAPESERSSSESSVLSYRIPKAYRVPHRIESRDYSRQPLNERVHEAGYLSNSSSGSLKETSRPRREHRSGRRSSHYHSHHRM